MGGKIGSSNETAKPEKQMEDKIMNRVYLVTGAAGFLGGTQNIIDLCLEDKENTKLLYSRK